MTSIPSDRPIALVTGANRGLGLETSKQLLEDGYRVILTSRDKKAGLAAALKLNPAGTDVLFHQLDVLDSKSIAALVQDLPGLAPRLDLLVNNAGVGSWGADRRASVRTIETNYFGSRDVTDALLPFIPNGGRVVMVSSGLGELSYMGRDLRPRFADPSLTRPVLDSLVTSYLAAWHHHQLGLPRLGPDGHGRGRRIAECRGRRPIDRPRGNPPRRCDRPFLSGREKD